MDHGIFCGLYYVMDAWQIVVCFENRNCWKDTIEFNGEIYIVETRNKIGGSSGIFTIIDKLFVAFVEYFENNHC